jgi:hypothetical protein
MFEYWEYALQRVETEDTQPSWVFEPFHESRDKEEVKRYKEEWEDDIDLKSIKLKVIKRKHIVEDWIDD